MKWKSCENSWMVRAAFTLERRSSVIPEPSTPSICKHKKNPWINQRKICHSFETWETYVKKHVSYIFLFRIIFFHWISAHIFLYALLHNTYTSDAHTVGVFFLPFHRKKQDNTGRPFSCFHSVHNSYRWGRMVKKHCSLPGYICHDVCQNSWVMEGWIEWKDNYFQKRYYWSATLRQQNNVHDTLLCCERAWHDLTMQL